MSGGAARPNLLMIVSDQERADVLGCYGGPCRTPAIDGLAAAGVRFETCLAPTAICSPTRASFLTGLYPHSHGILNNVHEPDAIRISIHDGLPTYSELLHDAGYRMGYVGKWHAGSGGPHARGFDDVVTHANVVAGVNDEAIVEHDVELDEPVYARYPSGRLLIAGIDPRPPEATETRADADAAIGLLRRYASEANRPFAIRLDFEGPHHPYMPPREFAAMYEPASIPPWPSFDEDLATKPAAQRRLLEQRGVAGWSWADWQPVVARYFGFVSYVDFEIGRVLAALDGLGLAETTVVIHTADHGDMTGTHGGQFNKGPLMYDEVCRVPLIVRDSRSPVRGVCRAPVGSPALMPTILDLAGLPVPAGLQFESLVPALRDPGGVPARGAAFAEYHGEEWGLYSMRMIRTETAKYVYSPHGTDELYDLVADPYERVNLVDDADHEDLRRELRARLRDWMLRTDDPLALWAQRIL